VTDVLAGGTAVACLAIGLFFLRFWRESHDRLFLAFAAAFWIFGLNRLVLAMLDRDHEARVAVYSLRAAAFVVLVVAIVDRNRR
jgi:hypothetical protein